MAKLIIDMLDQVQMASTNVTQAHDEVLYKVMERVALRQERSNQSANFLAKRDHIVAPFCSLLA